MQGSDLLQIVHGNTTVCYGVNYSHRTKSHCTGLQDVITIYLDGVIPIFGVVNLFFASLYGFVSATHLHLDSARYD